MKSTNLVLYIVVALNFLALFIGLMNSNAIANSGSQTQAFTHAAPKDQDQDQIVEFIEDGDDSTNATYSFDDPFIAEHLLEQLDVFSVVSDDIVPKANYSSTYLGFKINNNYCSEHREYFVHHPQEIFQEQKIITSFWNHHKARSQVVKKIGQDLHPLVNPIAAKELGEKMIHDMRVDASMFFLLNLFFHHRQVGKQFSCLTQTSNHIPGHESIYRKDNVGYALVNYADKYESRSDCFNYRKFFPKTWLLPDVKQCKSFFREFNSQLYEDLKEERKVVYFRKIGANIHEGHGVFPVTAKEEAHIRKLYQNGTLCGKIKENNIMQYNVYNPLLLNGRKFHFRKFLFIASTNPVIAYYHDGYLRLAVEEYDLSSMDAKTFITNIGMNLKEDTLNGMDHQQIQEYTTWYMTKFHAYLMDEGLVTDPNWLDNYLRPQFKKVMVHLIRMAQHRFARVSSVHELYGLDFIMDENLGIWFIEANAMPLLDGFTKGSTLLINEMLEESFEIVYGLLRSRTKRIINYVNKLMREMSEDRNTNGDISDLDVKRAEFDVLTQNRFEREFEISAKNGFQKIIDENESGVRRYDELLEEECLAY